MSCTPAFELRFSANIHIHNEEKDKYISLMKTFIDQYDFKGEHCEGVKLFQVARLGFSGAQVFYVYIQISNIDTPDVKIAKFDNYLDIRREAKKAKCLGERENEDVFGAYQGDCKNPKGGLLLYKAVQNADEFLNIMLSGQDNIYYCISVLDKLYTKLIHTVYSFDSRKKRNILIDYKRYLNRKNNPLQKAQIVSEYFNEEGQKLFSFYQKLANNPKQIYRVKVHGDLHARNILANGHGSYLIDFDWVHQGHIAKDFTLLESTLLYMILPSLIVKSTGEHLELSELKALHKQLYNSFELAECIPISRNRDKNACVIKVFEVIKVIRKHAFSVMGNFYNSENFLDSFEEYKYSLVLISLSQISFQDANLEILVHTANSIIDTLDETI